MGVHFSKVAMLSGDCWVNNILWILRRQLMIKASKFLINFFRCLEKCLQIFMGGEQFHKWLLGPEKIPGLSMSTSDLYGSQYYL